MGLLIENPLQYLDNVVHYLIKRLTEKHVELELEDDDNEMTFLIDNKSYTVRLYNEIIDDKYFGIQFIGSSNFLYNIAKQMDELEESDIEGVLIYKTIDEK